HGSVPVFAELVVDTLRHGVLRLSWLNIDVENEIHARTLQARMRPDLRTPHLGTPVPVQGVQGGSLGGLHQTVHHRGGHHSVALRVAQLEYVSERFAAPVRAASLPRLLPEPSHWCHASLMALAHQLGTARRAGAPDPTSDSEALSTVTSCIDQRSSDQAVGPHPQDIHERRPAAIGPVSQVSAA